MNDNFSSFLIFSAVVTFVAAFAGGFGWGVSQRVSPGIRIGIRNTFRQALLGVRRPFSWFARGVREWRRVSDFRHRDIEWKDLPQHSKDNVSFHDLSISAREAIKLTDISKTEKYDLIYSLILPELKGSQINGQLQAIDDNDRYTLRRSVRLDIDDYDFLIQIDQTGMTLPFKVGFQNASEEIPCQMGSRFLFSSHEFTFTCKVTMHSQPCPGTQEVTVWIDYLLFKGVPIFRPSRP